MAVWPTIVDDLTRLNKALFDAIKAYIDNLISVQGVPPGGATNDILKKASATDYDDAWTDAPTLDSVTLDTAAAEATGIAKIYWDATEGTVAFGMAGGVVTQQLGRNAFVRCKNVTASQINRGQVVYLTGAQGDRPTIELADATDESTSADTIGIAAEDIAVSAEGEVCISGILANVNTYGLTAGVMTYLSETAGAWTQTRPTQPAHGVRLGIPLKISNSPSGNSGVFFVQINNGYELEELHDVLISTPAAYDILQRNAANTLWVNTPSSSISIGTAADLGGGTAGQIPYQASPGDTQFFGPGTAGDILKSNGTSAPSYSAPAALTKTDDTNVTLTLGGSPTTALVNAASLTIGWTGQLAIARGGTGASSAQAAINALAGATTSGQYLRGDGTNVVMSAIQVADVPTLNQNTTGTASNVTGTVAIANGGSGTTTAQGAMNAFAGAVTSGSYLRGNGTNVVMSTIQAGDVPTLNQNTTGSAATLTTARTINGTSFNGSANITTASWGTARTLTIGNTGKSVDGSANVSWSIAEIGALALTGGTLTGSVTSATGMTAWNTTTPGTTVGNIQIGTANGTANSGGAITFAARDGGGGSNAQAGIYINSDGSYGTRMYLATTDSYVTGSKTALSINQQGVISFPRIGVDIAGTAGRNYFKDSEKSDGTGLRVGAAWGMYGIYAETGAGVVGGASGVNLQNGAVTVNTSSAATFVGPITLSNYNKPLLVTASGSASTGGAIAIQQVTSEGWTGIFCDVEPFTGWGFWHDNPSNYFSFTSEGSSGQIRSFTVPSRVSGNRTAYEKFRIDQNNGQAIVGSTLTIANSAGIASATNSTSWVPNSVSTYTPWRMTGNRNSYAGFSAPTTAASSGPLNLMLYIADGGSVSGVYNETSGWHFYWGAGAFNVYPNTNGGGTLYTLHSGANTYWNGSPYLTGYTATTGTTLYAWYRINVAGIGFKSIPIYNL